MGRFRIPRFGIRNTCIRCCLYMTTVACVSLVFYFDVARWKIGTTGSCRKQLGTTRSCGKRIYKQESRKDFRYHEEFTNPLNSKGFHVRLALTPEEQRALVSQNLSLEDLGLSLPGNKTWSRANTSRTRRRNLDLLGLPNITFNQRYKNPCWRGMHQTMYCLPYFFMIGAPKCGTTDLYQRLIKHPDVVPTWNKEPHWLTRVRTGPEKSEGLRKDPSAFTVYLTYFLKLSLKMYNDSNSEKITGDCSASTLWDNDIWTRLPRNDNPLEPVYTNADYVYKLNKNAKIIVLLRDPVQRLYSDYLYFEKDNMWKSPAIFHDHVVQTVRLFTACMAMFSVRSCVYHAEMNSMLKVRLRIGIYYMYLAEWYRRFPADQILVLGLDEYAKNTKKYLRKVFTFLDLTAVKSIAAAPKNYEGGISTVSSVSETQETLDETLMDVIAARKRANSRSDADKTVGGMWPETRNILSDFYRPFNARLYDLINGNSRDQHKR